MTDQEREVLYKKLGQRIKHCREDASLTQAEISDLVGLSRSSIVNIEKGRQHAPLYVIWDLAAALETKLADIIPEVDEVLSPKVIEPGLAAWVEEELGDRDPDAIRQLAEFIQSSRTER